MTLSLRAAFRWLLLSTLLVTSSATATSGCSDPTGGECCKVCDEGKPCGTAALRKIRGVMSGRGVGAPKDEFAPPNHQNNTAERSCRVHNWRKARQGKLYV